MTTTTKVDLAGVDTSKIDDSLFKKEKKAKSTHEEKFFAESKVTFQSLFWHFLNI